MEWIIKQKIYKENMIRRNIELSNIITDTDIENLEQKCMKKKSILNKYQRLFW